MQNGPTFRLRNRTYVVGIIFLFACQDIVELSQYPPNSPAKSEVSVDGWAGGLLSEGAVGHSQHNLFVLESTLWESTTLPVCWENPTEDNRQGRMWVEDQIKATWGRHSALEFAGWGPCSLASDGIRIRVADSFPATKALGKGLDGVANGITLNFEFKQWSTRCAADREGCIRTLATHEFGHALGFAHEQNRSDSKCHEREQGKDGDRVIGPWDLSSVMNYCNPTWNGDGNLSPTDIRGVQQIYGKSPEALQAIFDICSTEKSQGWQDSCVNKRMSNPTFDGTCACGGTLLEHRLSGEVVCDSGTPNCLSLPSAENPEHYRVVGAELRRLYEHCDSLRAQSKWMSSCDHPAVNDTRLFEGACECRGDVYRHRELGVFVCSELPKSCGGLSTSVSESEWEVVKPNLHSNEPLEELYNHCNQLRVTKGDHIECDSPAVDDANFFNGACGCETTLVRHTASGLYRCPKLPESCGGIEFVPAMEHYDTGHECYEAPAAEDYRGSVSTSKASVHDPATECLPWTSDIARAYGFTVQNYPNAGLGEHNHCRNPLPHRQSRPFCFTENTSNPVNDCDVGEPSTRCVDTQTWQCAPMPCENQAECVHLGDHYACHCPPGFHGERCEQSGDACSDVECNHGVCEITAESFRCECDPGWEGSRCAQPIDFCASSPCANEALCVNDGGSYRCECLPGWTGPRCETNVDDCASNPCQNAGACVDGVNDFACVCLAGWTGSECTINIDDCSPNPCQNDGVCVDELNDFHCLCGENWRGSDCSIPIVPAPDSPACQNGGTRPDDAPAGACLCAAGWEGERCELNTDECVNHQCQNGGTCVDGVNIYTCECAQGYSGMYCEHVKLAARGAQSKPVDSGGFVGGCAQTPEPGLTFLSLILLLWGRRRRKLTCRS
ncbi:MAG: hypothetical protein VX699_00450 [Myxococcota bacterium]|nr:hypothetical protein [Myxococcota bacterium]